MRICVAEFHQEIGEEAFDLCRFGFIKADFFIIRPPRYGRHITLYGVWYVQCYIYNLYVYGIDKCRIVAENNGWRGRNSS